MDGISLNSAAATRGSIDDGAVEDWSRRLEYGERGIERPASFFIEFVSCQEAARHHIAWADLCRRAIEPNVFLEPSFAVPLMQHVEPHGRPKILLVWERDGPVSFERLVGLMPVSLPRHALPGIARAFRDEQIALGTPLLDTARAQAAFAAMITCLRDTSPRTAALLMTTIPSDGAFDRVVSAICRDRAFGLRRLDERDRAICRNHAEARLAGSDALSAKRLKERKRQNRRLSEVGARVYTSATTPSEVARALERFLALEHNGWKGRRGTSLLADGRRATFARTMTRLMAYDGQCRIDAIEIDGRPVAMGILLTTGVRAYFWKTAFDESLGIHSPGVQFVREVTDRLRVDPRVDETDSCATPGHTMIDPLWPERKTIVDLMIGVAPPGPDTRSRRFERAVRLEELRRQGRATLKAGVARFRRR